MIFIRSEAPVRLVVLVDARPPCAVTGHDETCQLADGRLSQGIDIFEALLRGARAAVWLLDADASHSFAERAIELTKALGGKELRVLARRRD